MTAPTKVRSFTTREPVWTKPPPTPSPCWGVNGSALSTSTISPGTWGIMTPEAKALYTGG